MGSRILTHNLGYPRMGALRQLKKSLEAYWKGRELEVDLHRTASDLRRIHWLQQKEAGIDLIPSNDLSLYDHVLADLRGLSPRARAMRIIENCAHPAYRDALHRYLQAAPMGHIRHDLRHCFDMHLNYLEHGAMLPDLNVAQFGPHHVPAADKA